MKLILIILVAVVVGLMVAGGGSGPGNVAGNQYPKELAEAYVEGCVVELKMAVSKKGTKKFCSCTL